MLPLTHTHTDNPLIPGTLLVLFQASPTIGAIVPVQSFQSHYRCSYSNALYQMRNPATPVIL